MDGKDRVALVLGVANKRSIAWAIAQRLHQADYRLVLTYQSERLEKNVRELAQQLDPQPLLLSCDVTRDDDIGRVMEEIGRQFGRLDALVHAVAYAPAEDLKGPVVETSRSGFAVAQDVSAYSLVALLQKARNLMQEGSSALTLTYYGAEKVVPGYNVMGVAKASLEACVRYLASDLGPAGIRVNAISAGPVNTLAARGVPGFTDMLKFHAQRAPLRRNVTPEEIAEAAYFLLSPSGSGITGEILYVDAGYHIMGL